MKTSESIKHLTKALVAAQAQMGSAIKGADNPFFKSKYAGLPQVMEVVKGPLNDAGIAVLQPGFHRDGKNFIETILLHSDSGEFISGETEVVVPTAKAFDPQAHGSAQTYARRFGLQAMLFIPAEDKDAEDLHDRGSAKPAYKPAYQAPAPKPTVVHQVTAPVYNNKGDLVVTSVSTNSTPTAPAATETATVAPLQKSSFRKGAAAKPATTPAAAPATDGEWGS